jgi:hypothetical protein
MLFEPLVPMLPWSEVPARPELNLYAEVVLDAVRLVRGEGFHHVVATTKAADVEAARRWIEAGNVGVVTFDDCCHWLGWEAEDTRKAIFSTVRWSARLERTGAKAA